MKKEMTEEKKVTKWNDLLDEYFATEEGKALRSKIQEKYKTEKVAPALPDLFRAYREDNCPFEKVKAVFVGLEPYADVSIADGLAFSSKKEGFITPEAKKLFNVLYKSCFQHIGVDAFTENFTSHSLALWAKEGLVLVNEKMTVRSGMPGSHNDVDWRSFTKWMIRKISTIKAAEKKEVLFVFFGGKEHALYENYVDTKIHTKRIIGDMFTASYDKDMSNETKKLFRVLMNFYDTYYKQDSILVPMNVSKLFDQAKLNEAWYNHFKEHDMPFYPVNAPISELIKEMAIYIDTRIPFNFILNRENYVEIKKES